MASLLGLTSHLCQCAIFNCHTNQTRAKPGAALQTLLLFFNYSLYYTFGKKLRSFCCSGKLLSIYGVASRRKCNQPGYPVYFFIRINKKNGNKKFLKK